MEYLEGGSLADRLKEQKPLPNDAVLKYLKQILEGVDFLYQRNIYHSDIQGRSQVFIGGGASWGHINLSKNFSAKIDKTSLNFKNFQKVLKGFKVNFQLFSNYKIFDL